MPARDRRANHALLKELTDRAEKGEDTIDIEHALSLAKPCVGRPSHPASCRAKGIYRSLNMGIFRIHGFFFLDATFQLRDHHKERKPFVKGNSTYVTSAWLGSDQALLLHLRGIQSYLGDGSLSADSSESP